MQSLPCLAASADLLEGPAQDEVGPQEALRVGGQAGFLPYLPTATLLHAAMGAPPGAEVRCRRVNVSLCALLAPHSRSDTATLHALSRACVSYCSALLPCAAHHGT